MEEKNSSGRYMVWISGELRGQLEHFVRTELGVKVQNVSDLVNLAEIVRKAVVFALNDKRREFKDYLIGDGQHGK
jgi:hypothetical protein